ncbi:ABC transporter permease [Phytohabitans kaempferiae]|uniref:ABC transporter permease n=1 Tax=Phytohabitans kaempferiae TaxID=1620943 RepID=A0ABV6MAC4_9ACTN
MLRLILRRVLLSVPLIFAVSILTFVLQELAPGDTAQTILGDNYTEESYDYLRHRLGLDQPMHERYLDWLAGALRGDLGVSAISGLDVGHQIAARMGVTVSLAVAATTVSAIVGVALGVVSAVRGGLLGRAVDVLSLIGFATPAFWLGLVLVSVFAVEWRILPATGYVPLTTSVGGWLASLVLPVAALTSSAVATIAKQTRDGMLSALSRDFVHTLRANGATEASIIFRHALRNAAIPVVTVIGLLFVGLMTGVVVIEVTFGMPGLGSLALTAITRHDLPMVQGIVIAFTLIVVVGNLLVDLTYGWLNPKARVS